MKRESRELRESRLHLQLIRKAMSDLKRVQSTVNGFINNAPLREIYRGLRGSKANTAATDILVHTENISRSVAELEHSLRDGEVILTQQAKYYERQSQTAS